MTTTLNGLAEHLRRAAAVRATVSYAPNFCEYVGITTVTRADGYHFDGLARGAEPDHPLWLFQYTLAGWGRYAQGGTGWRVTPGQAFTTVLPSAHTYALPPESATWTFFYLSLRHPYFVERLERTRALLGPVFAAGPDDPLLRRALHIFEGVSARGFWDPRALEGALFEFVLEYERLAERLLHPQEERERLLDEVRQEVLRTLAAPLDISHLARARDMSRSHFSHHFKRVTGLPPARFVAQVRMEEVARCLQETDLTLEAIARVTGFASATHLSKVFRRHLHLSPGEFRRQTR